MALAIQVFYCTVSLKPKTGDSVRHLPRSWVIALKMQSRQRRRVTVRTASWRRLYLDRCCSKEEQALSTIGKKHRTLLNYCQKILYRCHASLQVPDPRYHMCLGRTGRYSMMSFGMFGFSVLPNPVTLARHRQRDQGSSCRDPRSRWGCDGKLEFPSHNQQGSRSVESCFQHSSMR